MRKLKNTLLYGALSFSFLAFPVSGLTAGEGGNGDMAPLPPKEMTEQPHVLKTGGRVNFGVYYGRPYYYRPYYYYYPYRPYYYRHNYYPYRPWGYYRW